MAKRKRPTAESKKSLDERVELRMTEREKAAYQEAANRQGISLSHWLRLAARRIVNDHDGKVDLVNLDE